MSIERRERVFRVVERGDVKARHLQPLGSDLAEVFVIFHQDEPLTHRTRSLSQNASDVSGLLHREQRAERREDV